MNNRRKLVIAMGAGAFTAPFGTFAQQATPKVHRIGFLGLTSAADIASRLEAFRAGLRELGYAEGKSLTIEFRFADGNPERLPELASELVQLKVDVIVTGAAAASRAAQKATTTIPIIFAAVSDPVSAGLIKSLAQPGGNMTGRTNLTGDLNPKRLELLLAMVPKVSRIAVLMNPTGITTTAESVQAVGRKLGVTVVRVEARRPQEIEIAFSTMVREKADALIVSLTPFLAQQRNQIAALATKYRLPAIAGDRVFAEAGCLMSYGANVADDYHRLAIFVDKILKGIKPGNLPVEQPTTFELVVNRNTAKMLGIKIPQSIMVQAAKVIE